MNLTRLASVVIGREREWQEIMQQHQKRTAVVLWGGPGGGKSTLSMDAACTLYQSGAVPGGALSIDLTGAPGSLLIRYALHWVLMKPFPFLQRCPCPSRTCVAPSPHCLSPTDWNKSQVIHHIPAYSLPRGFCFLSSSCGCLMPITAALWVQATAIQSDKRSKLAS
jgi:hypothetical protein